MSETGELHLATLADLVSCYEQINERMKKAIGESNYNYNYSRCPYGYMGASDAFDLSGTIYLFLPLHQRGYSYRSSIASDTLKKINGYLRRTLNEKYAKQKHLLWDQKSDIGGFYQFYEDIYMKPSFFYSEENILLDFPYLTSIVDRANVGLYGDYYLQKLVNINETLGILLRFMRDSLSEKRKVCVIDPEEKRKYVGLRGWDFVVRDNAGNVYELDDVSITFDREEFWGQISYMYDIVTRYARYYNVKCGDQKYQKSYQYWVYEDGRKEIRYEYGTLHVYDIC